MFLKFTIWHYLPQNKIFCVCPTQSISKLLRRDFWLGSKGPFLRSACFVFALQLCARYSSFHPRTALQNAFQRSRLSWCNVNTTKKLCYDYSVLAELMTIPNICLDISSSSVTLRWPGPNFLHRAPRHKEFLLMVLRLSPRHEGFNLCWVLLGLDPTVFDELP